MTRDTHTIDATNKPLGRLAVEIAVLLRGKNKPTYVPYKDEGAVVVVKNVDKVKITGNKLQNKNYYRHTGYIGHLKTISMKSLFEKNPKEVLRKTVLGMISRNRLRDNMIKRLKFE